MNKCILGGYIGKIQVDDTEKNIKVKLNVKIQFKKDEPEGRNWHIVYASNSHAKNILKYYKVGDPILFTSFLSSTPKNEGMFTYLTISELHFLPRTHK